MFHGVKDAWLSASETNMADVKELIPEFFYLPEFLLNENRFDLGKFELFVVEDSAGLPEVTDRCTNYCDIPSYSIKVRSRAVWYLGMLYYHDGQKGMHESLSVSIARPSSVIT